MWVYRFSVRTSKLYILGLNMEICASLLLHSILPLERHILITEKKELKLPQAVKKIQIVYLPDKLYN